MKETRRISEIRREIKKIQILAGILVLLCAGMLFALKLQASAKTTKDVSGRVRLNSASLTIMEGETKTLKLKHTTKKVVWKSTKKSVATVSSNGVVKAKKIGKCIITAKSAGHTYQCTVKVCENKKVCQYNKLQSTYKVRNNKKKIILAGSSCISHWKNAVSAFRPYEVLNMGIGGSTAKDWLKWYKKLIVAYKPSAVVLYPGTRNELRKYSEEEATEDTCKLLKKLHKALPDVPIYYVSIFRNFKDVKVWEEEELSNEKVKEYCSGLKNVHYIDVTKVLSKGEKPKANIFVSDGLHMNEKGYTLWNQKVVPIVKKALRKTKNND